MTTSNITPLDIFSWGIDYGQFLMEQEFNNNWADAVNCCLVARKTGIPTQYIPHREPHSEKWMNAKKQGWENFKNYIEEYYRGIK